MNAAGAVPQMPTTNANTIVADKWIKRGRRYVQTETRTSNAAGQLVATSRMTSIFAR